MSADLLSWLGIGIACLGLLVAVGALIELKKKDEDEPPSDFGWGV